MAQTKEKLNICERVKYFTWIPGYALPKPEDKSQPALSDVSFSTKVMISLVNGFSKDEGDGLFISYQENHELTGFSSSTIASSIDVLTKMGAMTQDKHDRSHTSYKSEIELRNDDHIIMPLEPIKKKGIEVKGKWHRLTGYPLEILYLILKHSISPKGRRKFVASVNKIANIAGCSASTATKALKRLIKIKAIYRPVKGKCSSAPSEYIPDRKLYEPYKAFLDALTQERKAKAAEKKVATGAAPAEDQRNEQEIAHDLKMELERHFSVLRQQDQARIDSLLMKLNADDKYAAYDRRVRKLEIDVAKAEAAHLPGIEEIQEKLEDAIKARARRVRQLGHKIEELEPQPKCKICNDTGFRTDDRRMCTCWTPPNWNKYQPPRRRK